MVASESFVTISVRVVKSVRDGLDELAKEYSVTRSEMMRIIIADVIEENTDDAAELRSYSRRKDRQ